METFAIMCDSILADFSRLNLAIDRSKLSCFSKNWTHFNLSMDRLVVLKSKHQFFSTTSLCDFFPHPIVVFWQWGRLPIGRHNSTAGLKQLSYFQSMVEGEKNT